MRWNPTQRLARGGLILTLIAASAVGGAAVPAAAVDAPAVIATHSDAQLGTFLTDAKGMTLYLFTKDAPGISNCYDQCAANWPPLLTQGDPVLPEGLPGAIGTTVRKDGAVQATYNGSPLYYWVNDHKPGDTTGQNVGGVWFVLNPQDAMSVNVRDDGGDLGTILTDARGMTLYLFTKDEPNVSNCYDQCATNWPPLVTDGSPTGPDVVAGGLGTTERTDGSMQVTYNGQPLYYWINDHKPGDTTGQNVGGVWFIVNP
jgi:predicted lipoprotein with Yx(FWY)xxD motif